MLRENYLVLGNIKDKYKKLCLQEHFSALAHERDFFHLNLYRQQSRQWQIFFGGDAEPGKYNKKSIRNIYAKLSRAQ